METIAHLRQNGRVTIMFCSFTRSAKILRLYGTGRVVLPSDPDWAGLVGHFGPHPGVRSIIVVTLDLIADSCGYSVPNMTEVSERDLLDRVARNENTVAKRIERATAGRRSIDKIPALAPHETDPAHQHT